MECDNSSYVNVNGGRGHARLKTLVIGGTGYIGGTVARQLLRAGHEVTIMDNLGHSEGTNVPDGAELVVADIQDKVALDRLLAGSGFDAVLHFAALIEAGESMRTPDQFFVNNTGATAILLRALVEHKVPRLVFSSTAAVFGNPETVPIPEEAKKAPVNAYGASKLLVEQMLPWLAHVYGLQYAVLRYFNVAGALADYGEAHNPETHLIPLVLDVALGRRESISIFGTDYDTPDGTCIRDYIHVADIGRAHLMAMDALKLDRAELYYNLGNGRGFSVREVIDSVQRVTGRNIAVVEKPRRDGDPPRLVASSEKIRRELGWQPEIPELDDIVRSAWVWHQKRFGQAA